MEPVPIKEPSSAQSADTMSLLKLISKRSEIHSQGDSTALFYFAKKVETRKKRSDQAEAAYESGMNLINA